MPENKNIEILDKNKYKNFTAEDLLNNSFFLKSIKTPTELSEAFWKETVDEGFIEKKEIDLAKSLLLALSLRKKSLKTNELDSLRKKIDKNNNTNKKIKIIIRITAAAAACILLFVSIHTFFLKEEPTSPSITDVASLFKTNDLGKEIKLKRGAEPIISISDQDANIEINQHGELRINSKAIEETAPVSKENNIEYNELIVPNGKRSTLSLPDGSKLWVNAGSRIVFPATFKGNKREIFLNGEIYIEVYPDKSKPFIVNTSKMDIQVLGTSFNITAYEEDEEQSVVLVTGSVNISTDNQFKKELCPNERFSLTGDKTEIRTVDPGNYIAWKDGWYISESEDFGRLLDRLGRYYGKKVIYNENVSQLKCSGRLNLRDNFVDLLKGLEKTLPITYSEKDYYIEIQMSNNKLLPMK
ncbi:MAG: FecR domain-containing protein [Massilibacteroides sp.]|nr:FecR domain-containing protein [Massilibacteroides sp.]MDD3061699.1 FecR domain-containing protein [Massilibacteroides sp.]MDD4114338.1 FecR domain-containing protein [Massilibacteroides sp.]MDD4660256.1 FecR domain-containing protein [Massilibacteroides sp.]